MTAGTDRSDPPSPDEPVARECVEGYLYAIDPLRILVFRRPPSRGSIWVPISGKVDPGDATLGEALLRELEEETGLRAPRRVLPLDWEVPFRADHGEVWRLHAYAVEVAQDFVPRLSTEHEACEWVAPSEAVARLHYPDNQQAVERLVERVGRAPRKA